jgi:hypothetical protein
MGAEPLESEGGLRLGRLGGERLPDEAELAGRDAAVEREDALEQPLVSERADERPVHAPRLPCVRRRGDRRPRELPQLLNHGAHATGSAAGHCVMV